MKWARDSVFALDRTQDVPGAKVLRTTRGTAVIPDVETTTPAAVVGPLDQAVFASNGTTRKQIYGVSGGTVYKLGIGGQIQDSNRFAVGWGDSSICYDSVNDKVIVSFWNEQRGDDAGGVEGAASSGTDGVISGNTLTSASAAWTSGNVAFPVWIFVTVSGKVTGYSRTVTAVGSGTSLTFSGAAIAAASGATWVVSPTQKGLYKINPDSLEAELFSIVYTPSTSGFNPFTTNTGPLDGPHQVIFRSGFVYCLFFGRRTDLINVGDGNAQMMKVDPVTLSMLAFGPQAQGSGSPFIDITADDRNGILWSTDSQGQEVVSIDFATFASQTGVTLNPLLTSPGVGFDGSLTLDMDSAVHNFGTFGAGYYLVRLTGGCSQIVDGFDANYGKYFVFAADPITGLAIYSVAQMPLGTGLFYGDQTSAVAANSGILNTSFSFTGSLTIGLNSIGFGSSAWDSSTTYSHGDRVFQGSTVYRAALGSTNINPTQADWDSGTAYHTGDLVAHNGATWQAQSDNTNNEPGVGLAWASIWLNVIQIVTPYTFEIIQELVYTGSAPPFAPYGICCAKDFNLLYLTRRSSVIGFYNISNQVIGTLDLGDPLAMPYRCRYSTAERLLYVAGYRSDSVYIVDPATNKVIGTKTGLESCIDVIFDADPTTPRKWAVCHGPKGLIPFSFTKP